MLPILLAGVVGFYFLFASWFRIGGDFFRKDIHKVVKRMQQDLNGEGVAASAGESREDGHREVVALQRLRKRGG